MGKMKDLVIDQMNARVPKVLTLNQPWASLYAHKIKLLETRPKPTSYNGTYLIHAAQKWTFEQAKICFDEPFKSELKKLGLYIHFYAGNKKIETNIPLGQIIGAVDIYHCANIIKEEGQMPWFFDEKGAEIGVFGREESFGDYRDGRYVWLGSNHRLLVTPIPYKNNQGYYQDFKGDTTKLIFK
jgi:hypothetical protein